jgi:hypothetical protein
MTNILVTLAWRAEKAALGECVQVAERSAGEAVAVLELRLTAVSHWTGSVSIHGIGGAMLLRAHKCDQRQ